MASMIWLPTASTRIATAAPIGCSVSAAKMPFWVIWRRKSGPPSPDGGESLTATMIRIGTAASTAMPTQLRRRPKMSSSSERKNRVDKRCGATTSAGAANASDSATDIEALPGQLDEHLLQVGGQHPEPAHRYVRVDQRGQDLLRGRPAEQRGDRLAMGL